NDFIAAVGRTDGQMIAANLVANTGLHTEEELRQLIVKAQDGAIIRLGDVANITLGSENYDTSVSFNVKAAVYVGIQVAPAANLLEVIGKVRKVMPDIVEQLPQGLGGQIVYDSTEFVNSSIREVIRSLLEAFMIVSVVIFLFLGSFRTVVIPIITIPLS